MSRSKVKIIYGFFCVHDTAATRQPKQFYVGYFLALNLSVLFVTNLTCRQNILAKYHSSL